MQPIQVQHGVMNLHGQKMIGSGKDENVIFCQFREAWKLVL